MRSITVIIASMLFLVSCHETGKESVTTKKETATQITNVESARETSEPRDTTDQAINFSKTIEPYIAKVLKENQRKHEWAINSSGIEHLEIFEKHGLRQVIGFSDKRYPRRTEPSYYEHFILFALQYDDYLSAKNSYEKIKKVFEFDTGEYENLGAEEKQLIQKIEVSTKPGGMICQKGAYVFSLVKTCRETPIGGKWEAYENLFLSFITEPNEEIRVLNANCGQMKYREERRKAGDDA